MKVRVVAFATASDILGREPLEVTLADGSRLADLAAELRARYPALEPLWDRLAVAVDGDLSRQDRGLEDGCEVALLPPVSGGSGGDGPPVALVDGAIDAAAVDARVRDPAAGAVVVFAGTVRNHHRGRPVDRLTYSAYRPMALAVLQRIADELSNGGTVRVAIVHRLGTVPVGEASVVIATASAHRAAAYAASRTALERLKREVPIWKREHYSGGESRWREEEPLVYGSSTSSSPAPFA